MTITPLILCFDNNGETYDRYTFILINEAALTAKTVESIASSEFGGGFWQHDDKIPMSEIRKFCEFSIVDGAIKCLWLFNPEYVTFLGQLRTFEKVSHFIFKKLKSEIEVFNYEYPHLDFQLPFLVSDDKKSDDKFIEETLLKDFFANFDRPSGFDKLVEWIKQSILDCNEEINGCTIATHYRYFVEKALENL